MVLYLHLLLATLHRDGAPRRDLIWENLALRQQLAVYQRQTRRPRSNISCRTGSSRRLTHSFRCGIPTRRDGVLAPYTPVAPCTVNTTPAGPTWLGDSSFASPFAASLGSRRSLGRLHLADATGCRPRPSEPAGA